MDALQYKYTTALDWTGKHSLGLTLYWNYDSGHVILSMPDYTLTALYWFKHPTNFPQTYAP